MTVLYEEVGEVLAALERRGCVVDRKILVGAMSDEGLHCPLDDLDIEDLVEALTPTAVTTHGPSIRMAKILASSRWKGTVAQARQRLRVPPKGVSAQAAKEQHDVLLAATLGSTLERSNIDVASILNFWGRLVKEARQLAVMLSMDPTPLDPKIAAFSPSAGIGSGGAAVAGGNALIGLRKILQPKGVFKLGGTPVQYHPAPTDHLMAHILWGSPLSPEALPSGPSISYKWERTPDGGGRLIEETFGFDQATASEIRQLQASLRRIKREFRARLLRNYSGGKTWEERWRVWKQMFPDIVFPSADALRHATAYQNTKDRKLNGQANR